MIRRTSLEFAALGFAAFAVAQTPPARPEAIARPAVELPPGPAARAFAAVGPTTVASELPRAALGGLDSSAWRGPEAWDAWAEAVHGEASGIAPDPMRRAGLAQVALSQERWDDAWDHFASTGADPELCAALLPLFLPGVPIGSARRANAANSGQAYAVLPGGIVGPLPDGVLLRPAPPPPSVPAAEVDLGRTWIDRREMRIDGLQVGAATLAMRVGLESDGIQIDFDHRGGGSAHLRVLLPELADFQVRVAYVDWMRQDEVGSVLEFDIAPGDETHSLFGRFRPRTIAWPTHLPASSPRYLVDHGLEIDFPAQAPDAAMFRAASASFARVLGLAVSEGRGTSGPFAGVRIDLCDPSVASRKFFGMVTLAERFALRHQPR